MRRPSLGGPYLAPARLQCSGAGPASYSGAMRVKERKRGREGNNTRMCHAERSDTAALSCGTPGATSRVPLAPSSAVRANFLNFPGMRNTGIIAAELWTRADTWALSAH
jgi:hypothetical protein